MAMQFFSGAKASAVTALTGAAVGYGATFAGSRVAFLQSNPYFMPAALFLAGHALKRGNMAPVGNALLTLSGPALVGALVQKGMVPNPMGSPVAAKGYGYGDAGVLLDPSDVRQLSQGSSTSNVSGMDAGVVLQPMAEAMGL